jgi:hypothetical protein
LQIVNHLTWLSLIRGMGTALEAEVPDLRYRINRCIVYVETFNKAGEQ